MAIDWLVPFYYSCVMYYTLYQACDSHKHIKLEQLRSAIKGRSVPLGAPRRVEMSYRSRTRRQCSGCSVFCSYDPESQSRGRSDNLQLPWLHTASPHHKVTGSSSPEESLGLKPGAVQHTDQQRQGLQMDTQNCNVFI